VQRQFHTIPYVQLGHDAGDVILDGLLAQLEPLGHLPVAEPIHDQTDDFDLALRELLHPHLPIGRGAKRTWEGC